MSLELMPWERDDDLRRFFEEDWLTGPVLPPPGWGALPTSPALAMLLDYALHPCFKHRIDTGDPSLFLFLPPNPEMSLKEALIVVASAVDDNWGHIPSVHFNNARRRIVFGARVLKEVQRVWQLSPAELRGELAVALLARGPR